MPEFKPLKHEKTIISMRLDIDLLDAVDRDAQDVGISRNEFIVQCIEYALRHLPKTKK